MRGKIANSRRAIARGTDAGWLWAVAVLATCGTAAACRWHMPSRPWPCCRRWRAPPPESPPNEKPYNVRLHFLKSNERRHDLFFSALRGIGGGYLGVGADQNFTLAAIAALKSCGWSTSTVTSSTGTASTRR